MPAPLALQLVWLAQGIHEERISFHQFYSPELFAEIKDHIGKPQQSYRVVSLGMHPGIALYNGFYLADGYLSDYPLEYKHRFRKVIAAELAKNEDIKDYFDGWGARCYLFSAELDKRFVLTKDQATAESPVARNRHRGAVRPGCPLHSQRRGDRECPVAGSGTGTGL